jgi:hypothetical protein
MNERPRTTHVAFWEKSSTSSSADDRRAGWLLANANTLILERADLSARPVISSAAGRPRPAALTYFLYPQERP